MAVHEVATCELKKKLKIQLTTGKVMCTLFWDRKGVILLDFLEARQTISSDHYFAMLTKLKAKTSRVRSKKNTAFLLDVNISSRLNGQRLCNG